MRTFNHPSSAEPQLRSDDMHCDTGTRPPLSSRRCLKGSYKHASVDDLSGSWRSMATQSGGGATLATGYSQAGLQPATLPAVSVTHASLPRSTHATSRIGRFLRRIKGKPRALSGAIQPHNAPPGRCCLVPSIPRSMAIWTHYTHFGALMGPGVRRRFWLETVKRALADRRKCLSHK